MVELQREGIHTEKATEREGKKRDLHWFTPPDSLNSWSWANLKSAARNFSQISHVNAGAEGHEPPFAAFPGHNQGVRLEREQLRPKPGPTGMPALQA